MTEPRIDLTEKLRLWGAAHAQARAAEQAASQPGHARDTLRRDALRLREQADRLHQDVYREIGRRG